MTFIKKKDFLSTPSNTHRYEQILKMYRQLPDEQKERVLIKLLRGTDVGRRIADGGFLSFTPHYMWERS